MSGCGSVRRVFLTRYIFGIELCRLEQHISDWMRSGMPQGKYRTELQCFVFGDANMTLSSVLSVWRDLWRPTLTDSEPSQRLRDAREFKVTMKLLEYLR